MTEPGLLLFASGEPFATGSVEYLDAHPELREPLARIYIEFLPQGSDLPYLCLLDTGGHYCILNNAVIDQIQDHLTDRLAAAELRTVNGVFQGELYLHRLTLLAQDGHDLDIEATVFVCPDWQGPNFLGYTGALDRVRFAVDPRENRLYFGPLD